MSINIIIIPTTIQHLRTSRVPLRSTGMPRLSTLFYHENFGWPDTCPKEVATVEDSADSTIYAFTHTNQHSGEQFEVRIRQSEYGREQRNITISLL